MQLLLGMLGGLLGVRNVPIKVFLKDLKKEITEDNVSNGAAALAYYLMLAIFPSMLFLLGLLPLLPIPNLEQAIMDYLRQMLPGETASLFTKTVDEIVHGNSGGVLSIGFLLTLWAASNGMYAVMQQLNITYDVKEGRPFWKARLVSIGLTVLFALLIIGAFALVIFGGVLENALSQRLHWGSVLTTLFAIGRWLTIVAAIMLGFALIYYKGPDVEQKFRFVSPGSVVGTTLLILASLGFKFYVDNFGKYNVTYGSLGAVIVLMLWLYITGLVILLGSEINSLIEHYSPQGKDKGEKEMAA